MNPFSSMLLLCIHLSFVYKPPVYEGFEFIATHTSFRLPMKYPPIRNIVKNISLYIIESEIQICIFDTKMLCICKMQEYVK